MRSVFAPLLPPDAVTLEIGSADGPSTAWLRERCRRIATDIDPAGLGPGDVCASADALPFRDAAFDVLGAFDVLEHLSPERDALAEFARVMRPDGLLLLSVPAYQWAWTEFDVSAGHHRRYTGRRLAAALDAAGFEVVRLTHAFTGVFPFFAADRLRARILGAAPARTKDGDPSGLLTRLLLALTRLDARLLRRVDLPVGSSILAAARLRNVAS